MTDIAKFLREPPVSTLAVSEVDELCQQRDALLAACKALLRAGLCDLCYDDPFCDSFCQCICHSREEEARTMARAAITDVEGQSE